MQLMVDALAGIGNRHGIMINPLARNCSIVRFDRFTRQTVFHLRAGIIIDGKEFILPLAPASKEQSFDFIDQRTSPCTIELIGIHAPSCIKLKLAIVAPFKPRDMAFSTQPVLGLRLTAESFAGIFRWEKRPLNLKQAEVFIELIAPDGNPGARLPIALTPHTSDALNLHFTSTRSAQWDGMKDAWDAKEEPAPQNDRLIVTRGTLTNHRFHKTLNLDGIDSLDLHWITHSAPIFEVKGQRWPFKYAQQFPNLDAVEAHVRAHPTALFDNAARVNAIIADNDFSASINNLLAYTLHSWAINTWLAARGPSPADHFFAVWEGLCYMNSTLDVEFTQAPFYLAVWPELLALELDHWTAYTKPGTNLLSDAGQHTAYFSHDTGAHACANGQVYSHDMHVEETANWLIMAAAHWRRTGDDAIIKRHAAAIPGYLKFLEKCDTTGNGVPNLGVANTIDDASPAIQFGREQVYLAVKTMAAHIAGATILRHLNHPDAAHHESLANKIARHVETHGWLGEHFATLLEKSGTLKNPWSGAEIKAPEIPGWNAAQIYTANALGLLDMVGIAVPLNRDMLQKELRNATQKCLREYGCVHSDFHNENPEQLANMLGLVGVARSPGWLSMNMARDIAAFYRGVDLRHLADRYWNWQTTTNTQEPKMFFETFAGNNLCFYPRGIAIWGFFDALAGRTIDTVNNLTTETFPLGHLRSPNLFHTKW